MRSYFLALVIALLSCNSIVCGQTYHDPESLQPAPLVSGRVTRCNSLSICDTITPPSGEYSFKSETGTRPQCTANAGGVCTEVEFNKQGSRWEMFRIHSPPNGLLTAFVHGTPHTAILTFKYDSADSNNQQFTPLLTSGCHTGAKFFLGMQRENQAAKKNNVLFYLSYNASPTSTPFQLQTGYSTVPSNQVVTVAVVHDGTATSIYLNGVLAAGPTILSPPSLLSSNFPFTLSGIPSCSANENDCRSNTNHCASQTGTIAAATCFTSKSFMNFPNACPADVCGNSVIDAGEICDMGTSCTTSCTCPTGTEISSGNCDLCSKGYRCPGTDGIRFQCTAGFYQDALGQTDCKTCGLGTSNNQAALTTVCPDCGAGTYQDEEGKSDCKPCSLGTASTQIKRTTVCPNCSPGRYQDETGKTSCKQCGPGTFQAQSGQSTCSQCERGTASNQNLRTTACPDCGPGTYAADLGQPTCTPCAAGTASSASRRTTACPACQPGSAQSQSGQSTCVGCTPGHYQDAHRQESCLECGFTSYQDGNNAISCKSCPEHSSTGINGATSLAQCTCEPGFYKVEGSDNAAFTCQSCPAGFRCSNNVMVACNGANEYQNESGSSTCKICVENGIINEARTRCGCELGSYVGVLSCVTCPAGSSCDGVSMSQCEVGTFQPAQGQSMCIACGSNSFAEQSRLACTCLNGYYRQTNMLDSTEACIACEVGHSCIGSQRTQCSATVQSYQDETAQAECKECVTNAFVSINRDVCTCNDGFYWNEGRELCGICSAGFACTGGEKTPCSGTQYQPNNGESQCLNCPTSRIANELATACICIDGMYATGDTTCSICPLHHACVGGVSTPCDRDENKYQDVPGSTFCKVCDGEGELDQNQICQCITGYYRDDLGSCVACEPGNRCLNGVMYPCTNNDYQPSRSMTECLTCDANLQLAPDASRTSCVCKNGYYHDFQAGGCTICPLGYYCANGDGMAPCAPDANADFSQLFYSDVIGAAACKVCSNGQVQPDRTSCICDSGYHLDTVSSSGGCAICPAGSACPDGIRTSCNSTQYQPLTGMTYCENCIENAVANTQRTLCLCKSGFVLDETDGTCIVSNASANSSSSSSSAVAIGAGVAGLLIVLIIAAVVLRHRRRLKNRVKSSADISISMLPNPLRDGNGNQAQENDAFYSLPRDSILHSSSEGYSQVANPRIVHDADDALYATTTVEDAHINSHSATEKSNEAYSAPSDAYPRAGSDEGLYSIAGADSSVYTELPSVNRSLQAGSKAAVGSGSHDLYSAPSDATDDNFVGLYEDCTSIASSAPNAANPNLTKGPLGDLYAVVERPFPPQASSNTLAAPNGDLYALPVKEVSSVPKPSPKPIPKPPASFVAPSGDIYALPASFQKNVATPADMYAVPVKADRNTKPNFQKMTSSNDS